MLYYCVVQSTSLVIEVLFDKCRCIRNLLVEYNMSIWILYTDNISNSLYDLEFIGIKFSVLFYRHYGCNSLFVFSTKWSWDACAKTCVQWDDIKSNNEIVIFSLIHI